MRALLVVGGLALGWLAGRLPVMTADFGRSLAAASPAQPAARPEPVIVSYRPPTPPSLLTDPAGLFAVAELPRFYAPPAMPTAGTGTVVVPPRAETALTAPPAIAWSLPPSLPGNVPPSATPAPPLVAEAPSAAFGLAAQAYVRLAAGDRRGGAALLTQALAEDPDEPNASQWRADLKRLKKRWSLEAWVLLRDGGTTNVATAAPVLGGGQAGSTLAYTINPLAKQPVSLVGRLSVASVGRAFRSTQYDPGTQQYALGVAWRPLPWAQLSAERLIAGGYLARNAFAVRAAAGGGGAWGPVDWRAYGETGVIGPARPDYYAGGLARAGWRLPSWSRFHWSVGAGTWGSVDAGAFTAWRLDAGPSLAADFTLGRQTLELSADWRFRVAGNTLPGSGPAVTLVTRY